MDKIKIYYIDINFVKDHLNEIISFVSESRRIKANKYKQEDDKYRSLGAGYLLKKYLPSTSFLYNQNEKPYLKEGPYFNITHSGKYIFLAVSEVREVGIDIQEILTKDIAAIRYVSSVDTSVNDMFIIWSNKESLIKCMGANMSKIKEVPGLPFKGSRVYQDKGYYTIAKIFENYSLSVTLKEIEPFDIEIIKVI